MNKILLKNFIKKYFESFAYFYSYLGYRVFIIVAFSIGIGVLDGFGIAMFLPLLQMVSGSEEVDPESLGNLSFLLDFIDATGLPLSLISVLCFMLVFFFLKGLAQYFAKIYKVNVQQGFIKRLRVRNIKGMNKLSYKYFVTSDVGRIQNTLTGEVEKVNQSFVSYFTALQHGIMVIVYMTFAFFVDAQFALLVSAGGVLTNFLFKKLYRNTKGISRKLTGENNLFQGLVIQNVSNYKYLKATGSLESYGEKLKNTVENIKNSNVRIGNLDAILGAGREPILISVVVLVIYIQTSFLGSELGPILVSLLLFYRALNYLMQMQVRWNRFLAVSGSLENMSLFGRELKENKEDQGGQVLTEPVQELQLTNVGFFYDQTRILRDVSLKINRLETVAFVGESGSGKTTLVNVIAGLLPVDEGSFRINNIDSKELNINSFQKRVGYITQDPVIFNDTLFNNITFWDNNSDSTRKRFWDAVKQAAIFDFIDELPEKENTILGSNGMNLSGGQRQRISIARELYKEVEVLILDEATSALDSETEKAIQSNIEDLKGDYTILLVAHRISTIKNADRIVVMKDGQISQIGSYSNLLKESGYFHRLVELQEL